MFHRDRHCLTAWCVIDKKINDEDGLLDFFVFGSGTESHKLSHSSLWFRAQVGFKSSSVHLSQLVKFGYIIYKYVELSQSNSNNDGIQALCKWFKSVQVLHSSHFTVLSLLRCRISHDPRSGFVSCVGSNDWIDLTQLDYFWAAWWEILAISQTGDSNR